MLLLSDHAGTLAFCDQNRVHLSVLCEQYFPVRNSGLCAVSVIRKMEAAAAPFPGYYFFVFIIFFPILSGWPVSVYHVGVYLQWLRTWKFV